MAVAVVVNDAAYRDDVLVRGLASYGVYAEGFDCAGALYQRLLARSFDALVLDLRLKDEHGLEVAGYLREVRKMGAVILGETATPATGIAPPIGGGADVWLAAKPAVGIVADALDRLARWCGARMAPLGNATVAWALSSGAWRLVSPDGQSIFLSPIERALLVRLFDAHDAFVSYDELVSLLRIHDGQFDQTRLTETVSYLRRKMRQLGYFSPLLSRYGYGYCFRSEIQMLGWNGLSPARNDPGRSVQRAGRQG